MWQYLKQQKYHWEVVIVDDGSTDSTPTLIAPFVKEHTGFSLLLIPHRGKAGAIIAGFKKAKGEILLFTDFDQSVPISEIEKLLPFLAVRERKFFSSVNPRFLSRAPSRHARANEPLLNAQRVVRTLPPVPPAGSLANRYYDIVIGSRLSREGAPLIRKITGVGFIMLQKLFLGLPYHDTQCGFKVLKRSAASKIISYMRRIPSNVVKGYKPSAWFDLELLYLSHKLNFKIYETSVDWKYRENKNFTLLPATLFAFRDILILFVRHLTRN